MGLDVHLVHITLPKESLSLLGEYLEEWKEMRLSVCSDKPAHRATPEEKGRYQDVVRERYEKAESYGWHPMTEVHKPATKNPYNDIGYWRVGYGVSSNPEENPYLGALYEAFPEAHPNFAMEVGADWKYAEKVVEDKLAELGKDRELHACDVKILESVLETIIYVLSQPDPEAYLLRWWP